MIPKEAMPIVRYIRKKVPRPKKLPYNLAGSLRWKIRYPGCDMPIDCCPMGMLPESTVESPITTYDFEKDIKGFTDISIEAFAKWWDEQTNAKKAIEELWG